MRQVWQAHQRCRPHPTAMQDLRSATCRQNVTTPLHGPACAGAAADPAPAEGVRDWSMDDEHEADHELVAARRTQTTVHHARPQLGHTCTAGWLQREGTVVKNCANHVRTV